MKSIYETLNSKLAKIIITSVIGFFFLCSLVSTIVSWNSSMNFTEELLVAVSGLGYFVSESLSWDGETPPTEIDYANAHAHLAFHVTFIFALLLVFSLVHLFKKYVDHDYFIRGSLSLGLSITLLVVNFQLEEPIKFRYFGIFFGIILGLATLFYYGLFIINKINVKTPFKVYLIHGAVLLLPLLTLGLASVIYNAIVYQSPSGFLNMFFVVCYPFYAFFVFVFFRWGYVGGITYSVAPLVTAITLIYIELVLINIVLFIIFIVCTIQKKKALKNKQ